MITGGAPGENASGGRSFFELSPGQVHVWDATGPADRAVYADFYKILDRDEQQRAERFRAEEHRIRFVTCRGWLRLLLSAYMGLDPQTIELATGEYGKPRLKQNPPDSGLVFNVSHSSDRMAFAFGLDCMLGVDIEQCRDLSRIEGMVERICSKAEQMAWRNLSSDRQTDYFFSIWVRKEAIIKAHGQGISLGLHDCELSENLDRPVRLPQSCGDVTDWTLLGLEYPDSFKGALALRGHFESLKRRRLPEQELLDLYLAGSLG